MAFGDIRNVWFDSSYITVSENIIPAEHSFLPAARPNFMPAPLMLPRFSIGVGDRFAHQADAQLAACALAAEAGIDVTPVWNKSNREHTILGSEPSETRAAANLAVNKLHWTKPYFVDADHITFTTVDRFLAQCDFFTIDVAEAIGRASEPDRVKAFVARHPELLGEVLIPGIAAPFHTDAGLVTAVGHKFLGAVHEARHIYRKLLAAKGEGRFVPEISMDETDAPQTPFELLVILAAIADEQIPIQTIAPKFTGRFNKGVEYVGDVARFQTEFEQDIAAIAYAVDRYGLPRNLKLSVHSGSDKFSLYPAIHQVLRSSGAGVHVKTAGTTWLEELIGLAESGSAGLDLCKRIYREAHAHLNELSRPYATVIDIAPARLPSPESVDRWSSVEFTSALRHDATNPAYNPDLRQLLHVGFKVAAQIGPEYLRALEANASIVAKNVTENLFERHIRPVFVGL